VLSFWDLELLGGAAIALSEVGDTGAVVGGALGFGLGPAFRIGLRAEHGVGSDYQAVLAGVRLGPAARPHTEGGAAEDVTPFALGLHVPLIGHGTEAGLGVMGPGFGLELAHPIGPPRFDVVGRADVLWFAGDGRDGASYQSGLAGLRLRVDEVPLAFVALLGYGAVHGTEPAVAGSGVFADVSLRSRLLRAPHGAMTTVLGLGLHGRFGMSRRSDELSAVYVAISGDLQTASYR
jgi:hypothetical protein